MKEEYILNEKELVKKGLVWSDYALDTTFIPAIIEIALGLGVTSILHLNDNFKYEEDIEKALDENPKLVAPFKKMQWQIIYNLIFLGDNDPINSLVNNIICADLRWGKVNGFQKFVR